jgi:hypothetical protein
MKAHGEASKWLMHNDQKEVFEILVALVFNVGFLALVAVLLWPLGKSSLAFRLATGYAVLWVLTWAVALLGNRIQDYFGMNIYERVNAYVFSNLAISCLLQVGWAAFAAHTVNGFRPGTSTGIVIALGFVGVLSCLIAYFAVSSFYQGHIYKVVSLPLGVISFIAFSWWPGMFFEL